MRLVFLSPYSPDFNPIEEAFSSIKAWLRRHRDHVVAETGRHANNAHIVLSEAIGSVTTKKAQGWFRDCGYIPTNTVILH